MGLLNRHSFKASPMSLAVPLEGSDTVVGLRELQRRRDGYELAKALKLDALAGSQTAKSWRQRYKGPFLRDIADKHLRAAPKDWRAVLFGQGWHSYNLPESLDHLCERAEENLMTYMPNYLRLLLVLVLLAMCLKPWSLVGAGALAAYGLFKMAFRLPPEQRSLPLKQRFWAVLEGQWASAKAQAEVLQQQEPGVGQRRRPNQSSGSEADPLAAFLLLVCYAAVLYSNLLGTVLRGCMRAACLVAGHACLRRSPTEYLAALKDPDVLAGRSKAVSGQPHVPGVAFTQALGLAVGSSQDPRRLFREAWHLFYGVGAAAGRYAWHGLQFYRHKAWQQVKAYVPGFLQ